MPQLEANKEKMKRSKESLCDLLDSSKRPNIRKIRILEGVKRKKGAENLFEEIIAENFLNLDIWTSKSMKPVDRPIISV